jgi:hypothetical protein
MPTPVSALIHAATLVTKSSCRSIARSIVLLFCYLLGKPYNEFIQALCYKILKFIIYSLVSITHCIIELYKIISSFLLVLNLNLIIIICYLIINKINVKWLTLVNKGVNQQLTSNLLKINTFEESSETARKITFDFKFYQNHLPQQKKLNSQFLQWFIGFTEGDGSFVISNNKVRFDITQTLSDIQVLYMIKKNLGFGKIIHRDVETRDVGVFYVTSKENFTRLVHIFNGNLCSPYKKEQFKNWLNVYNKQYNENVKFIDRLIKPCLNTA